ncbi:MAG: xanthine dehydrogenase molybdopterin binding subunit, partial [Beijerinckiaceae bacterium]
PTETQHIVARVLAQPDAFVTVETRRMGGGFGGKETQANQTAALAALAAYATGKPCKLVLDRDDDFAMTGKRHDFLAQYAAGFNAEGVLHAFDVALHARCGCSVDLSVGVVDRAMFHAANCYFIPDVAVRSRRWKTHTVSNTAFRGFGGPQGMIAIERVMEGIAQVVGRDPLDVRKANFYAAGRDVTPFGMRVEEPHLLLTIVEQLERTSDYRVRRKAVRDFNSRSRFLKKGLALTPVQFGISFTLHHLNQAGALVHVYQDGSIHVNHGGTEMGQGLHTKVASIVAHAFGVSLDRVRVTATNTGKVPNASPTAASSGTDLNGKAAQIAALAIRARMAAHAAETFKCKAEALTFRDGRVFAANDSISFSDLAKQCRLARVQLSEAGFYKTPKIDWDRNTQTGRPFFYFAYGAACAEVMIDTLTGEMKLTRVDILHDVGQSLNMGIDRGQIEGGFVQGLGWLTTEELVFNDKGKLLTHAPSTYKIPVASDIPDDFRVALYHSPNREETVFRSKAVGEPPVMLANAVFCAILDAIHSLAPGRQAPLDAPAMPESILRAVQAVTGQA